MSQAQRKFDYVMHEWKQKKLHSSSGALVKYPSGHKQAIAIAFGKARDIDSTYGMAQGGEVPFISLEDVEEAISEIENIPSDIPNDEEGKISALINRLDIEESIAIEIVEKHIEGKSAEQIWKEVNLRPMAKGGKTTSANWEVKLYDEDSNVLETYILPSRTEQESKSEVENEVDRRSQHEDIADWTMTEVKEEGGTMAGGGGVKDERLKAIEKNIKTKTEKWVWD